jgi:hypothetical protein
VQKLNVAPGQRKRMGKLAIAIGSGGTQQQNFNGHTKSFSLLVQGS